MIANGSESILSLKRENMRSLINVYFNHFFTVAAFYVFLKGKRKRAGINAVKKRGTDYDIYEYIAITWNDNVDGHKRHADYCPCLLLPFFMKLCIAIKRVPFITNLPFLLVIYIIQ